MRLLKEIIETAEKQPNGRTIFKDERAFQVFGIKVLDPWNDYTYEWTHYLLERYLEVGDVRKFKDDLPEEIDNLVDTYTSDLTKWLGHSNGNLHYLGEALGQGIEDPIHLLQQAQYNAIEEVAYNLCDVIEEMLE